MGKVEIIEGVLITRQGDHATVRVIEKKSFPKDTIASLLPIFEEADSIYPSLFSPEHTNWAVLRQHASYQHEEAINLLRRHGFGVAEVSDQLMDVAFALAGRGLGKERDAAKEIIRGWVEEKIGALYAATTEVTGSKK